MNEHQTPSVFSRFKTFFLDHDLLHYASSLSFHTLLALIPIMIISLFIFTQLPLFADTLAQVKHFILSSIMPVNQETISAYIDTFMQNTEKMGYLGVAFVLYVSVMFFDDFEYVVNHIYQVPPRGFWHSIAIYLLFTIMIPLGLGASLYLSIKANILLHRFEYTDDINLLAISSYLIIWVLFLTLYIISVNTKVRFKSALIASFFASLVWFSSKTLFLYYVTYNKTYTSMYGSFSTVMFFVIWIYLSWMIFLYGVKLAYTLDYQNKEKKERRKRHQEAVLKHSQNRREYIQR